MWLGMQVIIEDYVHDEICEARHADGQHVLLVRRRPRRGVRDPQALIRTVSHGWKRHERRSAEDQRPGLSDRGPQLRRGRGRRRRLGPSRGGRLLRSGAEDRLHHQGVPDPLAHRRGAGRHRRLARQHGRGRLALAHVRHRQGRRLARRPGRDRIHGARGAGRGLRARALGHAVLAARGRRQDLPAPVRRHDHAFRQGHRAAHLRRRRPHRPRHAAHHVRPGAEAFGRVLRRVFRHRPDHGRRGPLPRRDRAQPRRRHDPPLPRAADDPRDRRLRPRLPVLHRRAHPDRRRQRHGAARRPAAAGHGVRPVPPDRHLRRRLPDHRRRARRRRLSGQLRGRALHGALRAVREGPRLARRGLALDDHRDPRGPRRRQAEGPHLPAPRPSRSGGAARAAARHHRERAHLRRRRPHPRADPGDPDRALQHGRHRHQLEGRGADQEERRSPTPSCRA